MNRKVKYFKQTVSKVTTNVRSLVFRPWHRPTIFLLLLYCSVEVSQKLSVQVCQVVTVAMETTQLVLRQFRNFLRSQWRIEQHLSLPKIISENYELVKLCHINRIGPFFWDTLYIARRTWPRTW